MLGHCFVARKKRQRPEYQRPRKIDTYENHRVKEDGQISSLSYTSTFLAQLLIWTIKFRIYVFGKTQDHREHPSHNHRGRNNRD